MSRQTELIHARFRATYTPADLADAIRVGEVDRDTETLHGVQICVAGEARGHDIWMDETFIAAVADAGNAAGPAGIKVRFGHPAMCSDALGTYLGRATHFRVGEVVRADGSAAAVCLADIAIAPESHVSPSGDLGKWILDAAENNPDQFGQSIVFTIADRYVRDAEGQTHSYRDEVVTPLNDGSADATRSDLERDWLARSADGHVYVQMDELLGTDFTDTPAATDGVFSAGDLAAEAERMLDDHPQVREAIARNPDALVQFLERSGLLDRVADRRVAGIQSAKDHQIKDLQAALEAADAANASLRGRSDDLERQLASASAAADAKALQLTAEVERLQTALAEASGRAERAETGLRELGRAVNTLPAGETGETDSWAARWREARGRR